MACEILNITFDCSDSDRVSAFWQAVTSSRRHLESDPGNEYWVVDSEEGRWPRLVFVTVPEGKSVKNRVHLDLVPRESTQASEAERLVSLGARVIDDRRKAEPGGWIVLADPEGNEFCVESSVDE
jgi:predicted enzyme related to lactoylglutathione lyase